MSQAMDDYDKLTTASAEMFRNAVKLERDNATLKQAIRILAGSMAMDEGGNTAMQLTHQEGEYIKMAVETCGV